MKSGLIVHDINAAQIMYLLLAGKCVTSTQCIFQDWSNYIFLLCIFCTVCIKDMSLHQPAGMFQLEKKHITQSIGLIKKW